MGQDSTRSGAGQLAGNAHGIGQRAVVNRRRIEAPNRRQQQNLLRVAAAAIELPEVTSSVTLAVIVASQAKLAFRPGFSALVPQRFTGPGVPAHGAPALEPRPAMMPAGPVHAEKLHFAQLPTQPLQEPETRVHIIARVGQPGTD